MNNPNLRPRGWWIALCIVALFAISLAVRRPLFNREFTYSWEWLSAHTLMTCQLWSATPSAIHHFNLLYTFPHLADRYIDNLWQSGVVDRLGNYYYVSMPHLAFLTPYAFLRMFERFPDLRGLQVFGLALHLGASLLLFSLARAETANRGRPIVWLAAFSVLMFAPTALFFYQNAIVGTVLVIPYTLAVLLASGSLLGLLDRRMRAPLAWMVLGSCLLLGCLTDWQAYFTAFSVMTVSLALAWRHARLRSTGLAIAAVCCVCVALAIAVLILQDSRIAGFQPFWQTIFGRLRVRSGFDAKSGLGLLSFGYYRNLARFYSAYAAFIALGAGALWTAWRRNRPVTLALVRSQVVLFSIAAGAVVLDHLILAHHTAQQSFTTLNALVPVGILVTVGCTALIEVSSNARRAERVIAVLTGLCILISVLEYRWAYFNRPHPFLAAANTIRDAVQPSDVVFMIGDGFDAPNDFPIPQLLIYLKRNMEVVKRAEECAPYLRAHSLSKGILVHLTEQYAVTAIDVVDAGGNVSPARK